MTARSLHPEPAQPRIPAHVAIIMDGNGRWARARGLPRVAGHREGAEAISRALRAAGEMGISYLTLFGFSSENWKRPADEIQDLMGLLRRYLQSEVAELQKNGVRLRVIGDRSTLASDIVSMIVGAEDRTRHNDAINLTVALSYGGRQELVAAVRSIGRELLAGRLRPEEIDERIVSAHLTTAEIPDPDLLIRTVAVRLYRAGFPRRPVAGFRRRSPGRRGDGVQPT